MLTQEKKVGIKKKLGSLSRWSTRPNSVWNAGWEAVQTKRETSDFYIFPELFFLDNLTLFPWNPAERDLLISMKCFHILNLKMHVRWIFPKYCNIGLYGFSMKWNGYTEMGLTFNILAYSCGFIIHNISLTGKKSIK